MTRETPEAQGADHAKGSGDTLLQGWTLEDCLQAQPILPLAEVVRIGKETAQELAIAHEQGLSLGGINPSDLWLEDPDGRVKISKLAEPDRAEDRQADLLSLGTVLYRMTTGRTLAGGPRLESVTDLRPDTPPRLAALVESMLDTDGSGQPANAKAVIAAACLSPFARFKSRADQYLGEFAAMVFDGDAQRADWAPAQWQKGAR